MALLWFATLLSKLEEPVLAVIVILTLSFFIFFSGVCMVRFRWRQQYQRRYPDEFLDKSDARYKFTSDKTMSIVLIFWLFKLNLKERDH